MYKEIAVEGSTSVKVAENPFRIYEKLNPYKYWLRRPCIYISVLLWCA